MRLTIISTHPIQYFSPLYREIARRLPDVNVLYLGGIDSDTPFHDPGFGRTIRWDTDLDTGFDSSSLGIEGLPFQHGPRVLLAVFRGVSKRLKHDRPDVLMIPGWTPPYLAAMAAATINRTAVVIRPEARRTQGNPLRRLVRDTIARMFIRRTAATATIGSVARDELLRLGADPSSMFESPYTIDDAWWTSQRQRCGAEQSSVRDDLGISASSTVFIAVGKLQPYKRPLELIRIFSSVHEKAPSTHLILVGDGQLADDCRNEISKLGLDGRVTLFGFANQSELPRLFDASDVFVLPSYETWGLVANEAIAMGLPLAVSAEAGCSRDLVIDGVTGFRLNISRPDDCVQRLISMIDEPTLARLSENALLLSEQYTIDAAATGLIAAAEHAAVHGRSDGSTL